MVISYGIIALISLIMVGICIAIDKKQDLWLLMVFVSVSLCNLGYFMLSVSTDLEGALTANRIVYLGSVFLPFFMLMMVLKFCCIKREKKLVVILVAIGIVMLGITTSPGIFPIYYSNVHIVFVNHATMLVREYGPLHSLYYVYLFGYMFVMIVVTLYSILNHQISSYLHTVLLLCTVFCNLIIWFIEQFLPRGFEWLSISYILTEAFILIIYQSIQSNGKIESNKKMKSYTINVLLSIYLLIFANFVRLVTIHSTEIIYIISHMVVLFIYLGILLLWGFSVYERILNQQIKRYMILLVFLMMFWMLMRTLRLTVFYYVFPVGQWCWYGYYIGIILIPQLCFFASKYLGKPEDYRLSRKWYWMYFPSMIFIVGILTNDFHQKAFEFYLGYEAGWNTYHHGIIYYLSVIWIFVCVILMIIQMLKNCRVSSTKKMIWMPIGMVSLGLLYSVLYSVNVQLFGFIEMTAALCFVVIAIWESSIKAGLIPSNTYYDALLQYSGAGVTIVNYDDEIQYYSKDSFPLTKAQVQSTASQPLILNSGLRISRFRIRGGYALWQEDMTALLEVLSELESVYEELKYEVSLNMQNYQVEKRLYTLIERNRLNDKMNQETMGQIDELNQYLDAFIDSNDINIKRYYLKRIVLVGSYLKRRNNLFLISEQNDLIHVEELNLSVNEVLKYMKFSEMNCACMLQLESKVPNDVVIKLFDNFYYIINQVSLLAERILVRYFYQNGIYYLCVDAFSLSDLTTIRIKNVRIHILDENEYTFVYQCQKGISL